MVVWGVNLLLVTTVHYSYFTRGGSCSHTREVGGDRDWWFVDLSDGSGFQYNVQYVRITTRGQYYDCKLLFIHIPDSYDAKIAKNLQPLDILPCNSSNKPSF